MSMNKYLKEFLHRGLIFGGFGPIILGIIYAILQKTVEGFNLDGTEILVAIVSIYILAFLHAGASVLYQIEEWSLLKSTLCHFLLLYLAYGSCYLINNWIPFDPNVLLIFTAIFVGGYLVIWLSVARSVKLISRKLNAKLEKIKTHNG
ncbi:MAG: DUF3021 domain-containing protein [Clostridia bacterium]|nr:DUF3021 domain-containing protein [Clostridia bacterium]